MENMAIPRAEYPKPQFERKNWMNLNGEWNFEIDNGRSGQARMLFNEDSVFSGKITVPFCPESKLSGVEHKDFMYGVWYKREVVISGEAAKLNKILHIGAADYETYLYVNGEAVGSHKGGYVSFSFDVTKYIKEGKNTITIYCEDDTRDPFIPRGKQSELYFSHGCDYTRTTGIWQTVWLEFLPETHIDNVRYFPDIKTSSVGVEVFLKGSGTLCIKAYYDGREVGSAEAVSDGGREQLTLSLSETHLWEVGAGRLYDIVMTYGEDEVKSYVGLRSVCLDGYKFLINGKSVYQRLVLDQGFYPDGIYTAPSDDELLNDVLRSKKVGFNGARLHQKVFEERFLYHCDKEGYIVWGEYPNWGLDHTQAQAVFSILPEWLTELERDFNHPSIIGWCPFNETWDKNGCRQNNEVIRSVYLATKAADTTRPCIDTSGNYHVETDIYDLHDYEQDYTVLKESLGRIDEGEIRNKCNSRQSYPVGLPVFISEYGGIRWSLDDRAGWGYGNAPKTGDEFLQRYKDLTDVLLDNPYIFGFCYTQLTDVEQEQNGIYTYDRKEKFDSNYFYGVNTRKAAIED